MTKQVNFEWQKWMTLAALSAAFFLLAYTMAATMPSCPDCREPAAMQVFHFLFMVAFCAGSVGCGIASMVTWSED